MRSRFFTWNFVVFSCLIGLALAEFHPKITKTQHDKFPRNLVYFDDSSHILVLRETKLEISFDDGINFQNIKELADDEIIGIELDPFFKDRGFAFSEGKSHYVTNDKGKSWTKFNIDIDAGSTFIRYPSVKINVENKDLVLFQYYTCGDEGGDCHANYFYTKNGFNSNPKKLPFDANICKFAKLDKLFTPGKESTIYCTKDFKNSFGHITMSQIFVSDDYFASGKQVDAESFTSGTILDLRVESTFLIAMVQKDKFNSNSRVGILISKDGEKFEESDLKIQSLLGMLSFLAHSPQSLFVGVTEYSGTHDRSSLSTMYSTDSTGLKFTKVLDQIHGSAIQNVQTIKGAWLANVAEDGDDDEKDYLDIVLGGKIVKTYYTFDDGKDWDLLKVNNDDSCKISNGCSLHLISPNEYNGEGKFVTGPTPGILLGMGNKGKKVMRGRKDSSTWVSRDGGVSWDLAIDEPCHFSFGDQGNVILAVPYYGEEHRHVDKIYYSLDQGKSWGEELLNIPIIPMTVTTTTDSSSTKFVFNGMSKNRETVFYTIDFSEAFDGKKCGDNDFEDIYARVNDEKPVCLYGQKEKFRRRKQDAKCFVAKLFEDVIAYEETCECKETDFECAPGFKLSEKGKNTCVPDKKAIAKICATENKKEISIPDKVLIEGDKCEAKSADQFRAVHKFSCSDYADGDKDNLGESIVVQDSDFEGNIVQYVYVSESNATSSGENIILRTSEDIVYASNNGGTSFVKVPIHQRVSSIYTGYTDGKVILTTDTDVIYISDDGGDRFHRRKVPTDPPNERRLISFHKTDSEKFIWFGCKNAMCQTSTAYYTEDNGETFHKLQEGVVSCDFVGPHLEQLEDNKDLTYCSIANNDNGKVLLISTNNYKEFNTIFDNIVGYAITGKFVVVAAVDEKNSALKASVTVDGSTFADADFPSDLHVEAHQAYTVLDSATNAIFMHVTTNNDRGKENGALLKSNSNGTSYVLSIDDVNRNGVGFVDYDRIDEIEGSIIINRGFIKNLDLKKLKTQISHNDGGEWSYLTPPRIDSHGKEYECSGKSLNECSLNLHGFTERPDYRDTFSSSSAVGLLFGVGNVGEYLGEKSEGSTFLSRDGGVTWKEVKDGEYMWEFGDRGTILVLVPSSEKTNTISYSLDEGDTWTDFQFSDEKVKILDLATSPSDTSTKFVIFADSPKHSDSTRAISLDFTNIYKRQCQLDLDNPDNDDYEFWSPSHPNSPDDCLFGHEAKYLRRATGHNDCFIGSAPLEQGFKVMRNCTCTRRDYECDYNFYRDNDNTCKLVKGLSPEDRKKDMCSKEGAFQYFEPTGYRKIPLSTCVGGKNFDAWDAQACPGKEKQFKEHYGREINSSNFWFVFGVPILILVFATWFVYDRGIRRNGGFKRFGQIRLDAEDDDFQPVENNQVDVVVNRIVRGGIILAAGTYGVFKAIRKFDRMLLEKISSRIFRRSPGSRSYVSVPHLDEEEDLFGEFHDNYEEELENAAGGLNEEFEEYNDEENIPTENEGAVADSRLFNIDDDEELQRLQSQEL